MKLTTTLIIFIISFHGYSQDSRLFENIWDLDNLIINETNYSNLRNDNNELISLYFQELPSGESFSTYVCNTKECSLNFDSVNSSFTTFACGTTLDGCENFGDINVELMYFNFYGYNSAYTYSIVEDNLNTSRILTITAGNGDKAIYSQNVLYNKEFSKVLFSVNPNPIKDKLVIHSNKNLKNFNVQIFDLNGKLIQFNSFQNPEPINVTNLKSGFYFVVIEDGLGKVGIQKFIK